MELFDDAVTAGFERAVALAARAAMPLVGGGDGDAVDAAAVDALRVAQEAVAT